MSKHFCCCLSLKTGAILMSFLNLFLGTVETLTGIIELADIEEKPHFDKIAKKFNVAQKVCNATNFCYETMINKSYPTEEPGVEGSFTLYIVCLLVGLLTIFNGVLLMVGLIQAKEKYILLYILLGFTTLFIVTVYSGINMFTNGVLFLIFVISVFMCYGQISMYYFYEAVAEYNTVKSGVIEINFNGDAKSLGNSMINEEKTENTAV